MSSHECSFAIFDLDGTLINTEAIVDDAVVSVVKTMKKSISEREIFDAAEDCRGQRPLDASTELCEKLSLNGVVEPVDSRAPIAPSTTRRIPHSATTVRSRAR